MRSTDPTFVDLMDGYLHAYRAEELEEDDSPEFSADCGVQKALPGNLKVEPKLTLYFNTMAIYRGFSQAEMAGRLLRFLRKRATEFRNEFIRLDAGSVVIDGGAVLLLGGGDHRVAALTAALVERGAALLGDDLSFWEPVERLLHPLGLPITLDSDLVRVTFPALAPPPSRRRRRRSDDGSIPRLWPVPLDPADIGGSQADPAAIGAVVVARFSDDGGTHLERMHAAQAVFEGSGSVANLDIWGERALIALREQHEATPFVRLTTSSIEEGADVLIRALPERATA